MAPAVAGGLEVADLRVLGRCPPVSGGRGGGAGVVGGGGVGEGERSLLLYDLGRIFGSVGLGLGARCCGLGLAAAAASGVDAYLHRLGFVAVGCLLGLSHRDGHDGDVLDVKAPSACPHLSIDN